MAPNNPARSTYPSDDPIGTATGKEIHEWVWLLDGWCGGKTTGEAITRYLVMQYKLPSFWARAIAKRYLKAIEENPRTAGQQSP